MKRHVLLTAALLLAGFAPVYAQAPVPQSPEVQQFQKIEDGWSIAEVHRDQYAMELLLSPLYVSVSSHGDVSTRNQQISALLEHTGPQLISMEQKVVNVRTFGDMAVVQGTYIVKHHENGKTTEDRGIFTHVFQKVRNNWICVNAQRTLVVEQSDHKPKAAATKSDASLPFHIPLFHKGAESTAKNDTTVQPQ